MAAVIKALKIYLVISGLVLNLALAVILVGFTQTAIEQQFPVSVMAERFVMRLEGSSPGLSEQLGTLLRILGIIRDHQKFVEQMLPIDPGSPDWNGWGARSSNPLLTQQYDLLGNPQASSVPLNNHAGPADNKPPHDGRLVFINSVQQLYQAIAAAEAGDRLLLAPGEYRINKTLKINNAGTAGSPIVLAASSLGEARLQVDTTVAIAVRQPYWVFENLQIRGRCASHSNCEHAFHVVGNADNTVIRNNRMLDFNAMIKVNGENKAGARQFPDHGLIESNSLYNTAIRNTGNPVTPIDIVGASNWTIRGNLIADFGKTGHDRISYGAFAKGNASGSVFESNLIICQMKVPLQNDIRVGLSLGGGGSTASACRNNDCSVEHKKGTIRNNIILHCPNDVGIYLNNSEDTKIYNNTLYNTVGIDVRYPMSTAVIYNNILGGRINDRDQAISVRSANLIGPTNSGFAGDKFHNWFADPLLGNFTLIDGFQIVDKGISGKGLSQDFCGNVRDSDQLPDIGAMEYAKRPVCQPVSLKRGDPN